MSHHSRERAGDIAERSEIAAHDDAVMALRGSEKAFLIRVVADQNGLGFKRRRIALQEIPSAVFEVVCAAREDVGAKAQLAQDRCRGRRLGFALESRCWQALRPERPCGGAQRASRR